jgi:hypothetical protein
MEFLASCAKRSANLTKSGGGVNELGISDPETVPRGPFFLDDHIRMPHFVRASAFGARGD